MTGFSEEKKKRFIEEATQLILVNTVKRVQEEFEPQRKEKFIALFTQQSTDEQRSEFLEKYVPNFEVIFLEEALLLKDRAIQLTLEHARRNQSPGGEGA